MKPDAIGYHQGQLNWLPGVSGSKLTLSLLIIVMYLPDRDLSVWLEAPEFVPLYVTRRHQPENTGDVPGVFS